MRVLLLLLSALVVATAQVFAQSAVTTVRVVVRANDAPVAGAQVTIAGTVQQTDASGIVVAAVRAGRVDVLVVSDAFEPARVTVQIAEGQQQDVLVELREPVEVEETVTVAATRTDKRLEDQPMRVEVLVREEIEEKMLMTPGDIVMLLNEMGGMRVQATSPSLGAASVRVQGMRGRYTRFLSDGLPLFGDVGGLGLLQIPPMDLGQVEVIKGVASSLYGAGAMGGVVNLVSRRPGDRAATEVLLNRSARRATDAVVWSGTPLDGGWSLSTLAGGHWQEANDIDGDGWADLAGYSRGVVRPRLFWDGDTGSRFFATAGFTMENRTGGTIGQAVLPHAQAPYVEALATTRWDVGALAQTLWRSYVVTARGAASEQRHDHRFGLSVERDRHQTFFAEVAVRGSAGRHTWVAGAALERDAFHPIDLPQFAHTFTIPGAFAQDDVALRPWLSLSVSARADHHSAYGFFFSPRVATLLRAGQWSSRLSVGTGFFGPSVLTEETEAAGLARVTLAGELRAETGRSVSFDLSRTLGPTAHTLTVFGSHIERPLDVDRSAGLVISNARGAATNAGVEWLSTLRLAPFAVTASYSYVRAREDDAGIRREATLTPSQNAGIVGMWERENVGRVGIEWYLTGRQRLEENPYRGRSEPYMIVGVLVERHFGPLRLFINGENLTGVRQTRWDPLVRPDRAADGRWTVDAWAPLEGRNVNAGVRVSF